VKPLVQWVPGALSLGIKRLGREADHSPPSSPEIEECVELYLHSSNTPSRRGAQLKQRATLPLPLPVSHYNLLYIFQMALHPDVKQRGRIAEHSSPSVAEVKQSWSYTSTPQISLHNVVLN